MRGTAVGLNAKGFNFQSGNQLEHIASSLSFFVVRPIKKILTLKDYHVRMGNTVGYYTMIIGELTKINGIVEDCAAARALNRENLIEDAQNRSNTYNQMAQGAINMTSNMWNAFTGANNANNQPKANPYQGNQPGYPHQQ